MKTKVILVQLGSPKSPKVSDVRKYLREFLWDPRVVDLPRWSWFVILNLFVLPFRPAKSAKAYSNIWDGVGFPLVQLTNSLVAKITKILPKSVEVQSAFILSEPRVDQVLKGNAAEHIIIFPQFPQYAESTSASVFDVVAHSFKKQVNIPNLTFIANFHRLKSFIDLSVIQIQQVLDSNVEIDYLLLSFHGIPLRRVTEKKDIYFQHCQETFELLKSKINFPKDKIKICFQSRFGAEKWLGPATSELAVDLAKQGAKRLAVSCPSFVIDCLETTVEIGMELREEVNHFGTEVILIPALNDFDSWAKELAHCIQKIVTSGPSALDDLSYPPKGASLSSEVKKLRIVFLTVFLDIAGFSIIFPLIPQLTNYYTGLDPNNSVLSVLWGGVNFLASLIGHPATEGQQIVLFGCLLGAIYSALQFVAAPFWGKLSDQMGRRKILLTTLTGLAFSYFLWMLSGSFTLLVVARLIGGLSSGNISVASAVVADVTTSEKRSTGMIYIGIAFAIGFVLGPAMGGLLSEINLLNYFPHLADYGINPFSMPAIVALFLCLINIFVVWKSLPETHTSGLADAPHRTANLFIIFKPHALKSVNLTNATYFLFISLFAGMEFTLTFLTVERLSFSPKENGFLFVYIGLLIALVQGGFVRRKAHVYGEKNVALAGLILIIPGLILLAQVQQFSTLLIGLFFLSAGSALTIPTLTSMVSVLASDREQGHVLGVFRSLGALGRIVGPLWASLVFWRWGSSMAYLCGALSLLLPVLVLSKVSIKKS